MAEAVLHLDGALFGGWLYSGARSVVENQERLDRINVFPVPDGDTGSNLVATLAAAAGPFRQGMPASVAEAARRAAAAALDGARGNSGAIVAQFLHGFAAGVHDLAALGARAFAEAARRGTEAAYRALRRPQEGTMLSVLRAWADGLAAHARDSDDLALVMQRALGTATSALARTPQQLAVLAEHGVVDAGGQGFIHFLQGAGSYLETRLPIRWDLPSEVAGGVFAGAGAGHGGHRTAHRFCSEALVQGRDLSRQALFDALDPIGDSLVVAGQQQRRLRVHLHTDQPRLFFDRVAAAGELAACKIDDMWLQQDTHEAAPIALVTDSTCDLPELEALGLHVYSVPLSVRFGRERYLDGVDLAPAAFFQKLAASAELPSTSQPAAGDFQRLYARLLERYPRLISVHIAGSISGTVEAARAAAEQVAPERIRVIDSRQVSVGLGLVVAALGRAIRGGADLETVAAQGRALREQVRVFGSTPSLQHAVRGGRVDARVAWLLERLGIKPLVHFDDSGKPYKGGVAVGFKRAMRRLAKQARDWAAGPVDRALVVHAAAHASGDYLARQAQQTLDLPEVPIVPAGSVLGNHVGPGAVALAVRRAAHRG